METCSTIPRDPFVPGQATKKLLEGNNRSPDFCKEQGREHQDRFLGFGGEGGRKKENREDITLEWELMKVWTPPV